MCALYGQLRAALGAELAEAGSITRDEIKAVLARFPERAPEPKPEPTRPAFDSTTFG